MTPKAKDVTQHRVKQGQQLAFIRSAHERNRLIARLRVRRGQSHASPFRASSFQENGGGGGSGSAVVNKRDNPHKYLLYKPTVAQFMVFMASGHRELPANGALFLYISGDGCFSTKTPAEDAA